MIRFQFRESSMSLDQAPYQVVRASVSARQYGGFLLIAAVVMLPFFTVISIPGRRGGVIPFIVEGALVVTGLTLFVLGDALKRRRVWAAQGVLAIGGASALTGVIALVFAQLRFGWGRGMLIPCVILFAVGARLAWHASGAIRELRPPRERAFEPVIVPETLPPPVPVKSLAEQDDAGLLRSLDLDAPQRVLSHGDGDDDDSHRHHRPAASRPAAPPEGGA